MVDFRKRLDEHRERTPEQREAFMARLRKEFDMARGKQSKGVAAIASKMPAGYTQRAGSFPASWYPEPGDTLEGTVVDYRTIDTKFGESDVFTVREDKTGLEWSVFVSSGLMERVKKSDKGKRLFIQRIADVPSKKKGRNAMKAFVVGFKK